MKVARKFSLGRIGKPYENIVIEVEGENMDEMIRRIEEAWITYSQAIKEGKVQ